MWTTWAPVLALLSASSACAGKPRADLHLTPKDRIGDLLQHPAFQGYAGLLLPWDDRSYDDKMPLAEIDALLPYHSHVQPRVIVDGLNRIIDDVSAGQQVFYSFYTEEQKRRDPTRRHAGLFFFRGKAGAPFAVVAPGGGFAYVGSVHEGFPYAAAISDAGYNAFVLKYRAGLGGSAATEDLAAALSFIMRNADTLRVDRRSYSLWGSSAGARMAAAIGSHGVARFGGDELSKPAAVIMAYTGHEGTAKSEPPTFVVVGEDDAIAPPAIMARRVAALRAAGTPTEFRRYPDVGHGFGPGVGTSAEGWLGDAIDFWARFMAEAPSPVSAAGRRSHMKNPFTLVYAGAITRNEPGKVNIHPVTYKLDVLDIAANVYTPASYDPEKHFPAIVVAHPNGGVKEQVAGLYAQRLAEQGYITIAADAAYQGASGGQPRNVDRPAYRVEDIHGMADFITRYPGVDVARVGLLGICGGGGYSLKAAQTDKRFKSIATLSMFNSGRVRRNGYMDSQLETIHERLQQASDARAVEVAGGVVLYAGDANLTDEQIAALPFDLYRQGYEYYWKTHAHPGSTFKYTMSSLLDLMRWDAADQLELLDQPLLMIAGSKADSLYMTEDAFAKAIGTKDKKLFKIDGATHIETYWVPEYVDAAMNKLTEFFGRSLRK